MAKRWCVHAVSSVPTLRSIWLLGGQDEDEDEEEEEEEEEGTKKKSNNPTLKGGEQTNDKGIGYKLGDT